MIRLGSTATPVINTPVQALNFVQSNDLMYRTALDMTGFNLPLYASSRNDDEKRENLINICVSSAAAFILAPLYAIGFNKLMASVFMQNQHHGLFHLGWQTLDDKTGEIAIARLQELDKRVQHRLTQGNWFDKLGFVQKGLQTTSHQFKEAITAIESHPEVLESIGKAKVGVLALDLLLTASIVNLIDPVKMWVTKKLSHKDRFTGSEAYLSDADLKALTQPTDSNKEQQGHRKKSNAFKIGLHIACTAAPSLAVLGVHNQINGLQNSGKTVPGWLLNVRNKLDYTNALYMTIGGLFAICLSNNLVHLIWARDQYEQAEDLVKYGLIMPSFFLGDRLFNGNIAKLTDVAMAKVGYFEAGTFIHPKHTSWWGAEPKPIQDAMEQVAQTYNYPKKTQQAGSIASGVFLLGFVAHSLAMAGIFTLGNAITKRWITKDLTILKQNTPTTETNKK